MKLAILFTSMASLLLSGCTLGFKATFEDLSLVREEPADIVAQYSLPGREDPERPLTGRLRLDFVADTDLIGLMEDENYNLWYEAETCESKVEIVKWPVIYRNGRSSQDKKESLHNYSVFLDPSWRGRHYNLMTTPESICVRFRAGKMVTLFNYRSNTIEIDRDKFVAVFESVQ